MTRTQKCLFVTGALLLIGTGGVAGVELPPASPAPPPDQAAVVATPAPVAAPLPEVPPATAAESVPAVEPAPLVPPVPAVQPVEVVALRPLATLAAGRNDSAPLWSPTGDF